MEHCTLQIETICEERTVFRADALFEATEEGGTVVYPVEADEGTISFGKRGMTMNRTGACTLSARFYAGEQTQMLLSSDGMEGAIPLETTGYDRKKTADGYRLSLRYTLNNLNRIQKFHLKIMVKFSEEK